MFVGAGGSLREREELVTDGNAVWASRDMADKVSQLKRRVVTIREENGVRRATWRCGGCLTEGNKQVIQGRLYFEPERAPPERSWSLAKLNSPPSSLPISKTHSRHIYTNITFDLGFASSSIMSVLSTPITEMCKSSTGSHGGSGLTER